MLSAEMVKKIREIEIYTRRLLTGSLVGDNQSAVKGAGFEFDQIREYQYGDDVRFIDWKGSARMDRLLVKQYIEERSRTIILAVDISRSGYFSSTLPLRRDVMIEVALVLASVATFSKDRVGALLYSDEVELFIPPGKGTYHMHKLMEQILGHVPRHATTALAPVLERIIALPLRDAVVFLISDFITEGFERVLPIAARKHDVIAVRCLDQNEQKLPSLGFITIEDSETGQDYVLDMRTTGKRMVNAYLHERIEEQTTLLRRCGADVFDVPVNRPFIGDIIRFFRRRMR